MPLQNANQDSETFITYLVLIVFIKFLVIFIENIKFLGCNIRSFSLELFLSF
jgi:hypothetical protein